jgi:uncharacterized protein (DUF2235 family)
MSTTSDGHSEGSAPRAQEPQAGKSIILFSDGTGNSSAKLFKTNVWRMYEAVDLGPPAADKRPQISYYDDGVGTSSFKPLAALGGAFGWGLKRNVLDIYRYACRNYRDGDDLYAFGFSRGAFTIRLVVALIASEGLIRSDNEAELQRKTTAAYRHFREAFLPRRLQWPTKLARRLRNLVTSAWHRRYDPAENRRPHIRFVGVWDTVAAYGGPIVEITRAVDNWFFPLSMPDYCLDVRVQCARHALAIDDERDAFHPLLWDEVHEAKLIEDGAVDRDRLQQVWFTGMHADVGGGYPDESLSYVSLLWMMEQAERAGLRTLTVIKDRILALASSFGPLHDSRAGVGAYYRYQPRRISAWLDPVDGQTLGLRDPAITDRRGRSRGLLRSVSVHESVINRIATGTDRYAPITLPETFAIVPPQEQGENAPQADSQTDRSSQPRSVARPMVDPAVRVRLQDAEAGALRSAAVESVWDFVWCRRITYFVTLAATLLLVALPLIVGMLPTPPLLADGRTWIGGVIRLLTIVLPAFAGEWVEVYADNPFYFLVFAGVVLLLLALGNWMERTLRDKARHFWRLALAGTALEPHHSLVQRFRNSNGYQRLVQLFKWYLLPDWVITPATVLALAYLLFGAYVQARLPFLENGTALCRPPAGAAAPIVRVARAFSTRDICSESFGSVRAGERYVVTFDVAEPWYDSSLATSPEGLSTGEFPMGLGYLAVPLKRVIHAHYLQPLIEIRDTRGSHNVLATNVQIYPLSVRQVGDSRTRFRAEFKAARDGALYLFVNDAMLPFANGIRGFDYRYFYEQSGDGPYRGNRGTACVTVESDESAHGVMGPGPECRQASAGNPSADR